MRAWSLGRPSARRFAQEQADQQVVAVLTGMRDFPAVQEREDDAVHREREADRERL
ncbi:hypothetical protein ACFR9U_05865 [Halorientalis brevis]|uniref:Uncharacterized protein n=1 Tax=Halorientalis brevis TaxID=1126241 RepID=A0ABD6C9I3_9EURY|nr:hypothetical protein [Halorientalis brevis]